MRTAEEILAEAAATIERGWWQSGSGVVTGECVITALYPWINRDVWTEAIAALSKELGCDDSSDRVWQIIRWNDRRGQTKEAVATTLRNSKRHLVAP